jgi:hypothetical protein
MWKDAIRVTLRLGRMRQDSRNICDRSSQLPSAVSLTASNPFSDANVAGEDENWDLIDDMSTFNPYCGAEKGFILYEDEVEDDDDDHMPKDDDDSAFKPKFRDYFHRRVIVSTIGAICLILGTVEIEIGFTPEHFTDFMLTHISKMH